MSPELHGRCEKYAKEMDQEANGEVELHRPFIDDVTIHPPGSAANRCTVYRRLSTAGLIPVPCHLHSIIIHLKNKELFE